MGTIENEIEQLDLDAVKTVDNALRTINIALNLNANRMKTKKPESLIKLQQWKNALEYWKDRYGQPTNEPELMAERLGQLYGLCIEMKHM